MQKQLKIDPEFKQLIPPLSQEEFLRLEENIKTDGCRDALVVWDGVIIDGHNRYEICQKNNIPFKTLNMEFKNRSEVVFWMLSNQLGRRNLNDFQRNEVALKFQEVISEKMKERQRLAGGDRKSIESKIADDQLIHSDSEKTNARKEMAKIANTSEGSIQRSKLILEKGTPEQIERARQGGAGNSVHNIYYEVLGKPKPGKKVKQEEAKQEEIKQEVPPRPETKVCKSCQKELLLEDFYPGKGSCKKCVIAKKSTSDFMGNKLKISPEYAHLTEEDIIGDLYDVDAVVVRTIDDAIEEFTCNFETYLHTLDQILEMHVNLFKDPENNKKIMTVLSEAVTAMNNLKGKYSYEKL